MADNVVSALCYALGLITGIIFLVLAPYNRNPAIRFHAFQSIFMCLAYIGFRVLVGLIFGIMGLFSFFFVFTLISFAGFALWIFMLLMTYQGKTVVLPLIGQLARQQAAAA